jgi:hypothetical protein
VGVDLRRLELSQFGATVGQSVGDRLVIASTLKLVRGGGTTTGDLDLGAMATIGILRMGVAVRNVTEPVLGGGSDVSMTLHRQVRAGAALIVHSRKAIDDVALDVDLDLTKNRGATGDLRRVAAGVEMWTLHKQLGLRGGISMSTIATLRAAPAAGLSFAVRRAAYVDVQVTGGPDQSRAGWGVDLRVTF